jgi:hypothetical protein
MASGMVLVAPALGTPASGVMTNVTGTASGLTAGNATLAATVTVADSTANTNFPIVLHNESNALLDDTGAFTYNPSTATLVVSNINVSGTQTFVNTAALIVTSSIIFEGATADGYETTLTVTDPTADRTWTLQNASDTIVGRATTDTLTNKTINSNANTLHIDLDDLGTFTGTLAEFNSGLQGDSFVSLTGTETLTNKTLTSPTLTTPDLGTPSALVLTNATALPAAQVAQGTMASGMVLVAPALGTPASGTATNITGLPIVAGTTGTLSVARGGTGVTTSTGTGNTVLSASPTLTGTLTAAAGTFSGTVQLDDGQQVQWGGGNNAIFGHDASDYVAIKTNGTDRLKIDSTGFAFYNMPIKLSATEKLYLDGGSNTYIEEDSADTMIFATGGTTALTLDSSQNATFAENVEVQGSFKLAQASVTASTTTALNLDSNANFKVALGQNTTLSSSNESLAIGQSGVVVLVQDGTGGRTVALPSTWKTPRGAAISFDTGANDINIISYYVIDASTVAINYMGDFS